jgi:heat shock protein beta
MSGLMEQDATGLSLYVRKVLISDEFELLPRYLSFLKGVVDSDDLPLNVNRETLQESKIIQVIKKKVVRKALEMLKNFQKEADAEAAEEDDDSNAEVDEETGEKKKKKPKTNKYNDWYKQFSPSLKMGAIEDEPNRGKILKLLRFKSSTSNGELIGLEKYVENMKEWQKDIYFIAGDGIDAVEKSHFLEPFLEKGIAVLYFVDPVDEYMATNVRSFEGKNFKNIATDNVKLKDDEEDEDLTTRREKFYKEKFKPLTKWLKKLFGPSVMRVSISNRLVSAPAIVSSAEFGHSANMERIMRAQAYSHGQSEFAMRSMKIFEINPRHPMILKLLESAPPEDADEDYKVPQEAIDAAWVLHETALLNGGYPISDPKGHSSRILKFLQSQLGLESLELEPHPELPVEEEIPPELDGDMDMDELVNMVNMDDDDGEKKPKGTSPEDAIPLNPDEDGNVHIEL